GREWDAGQFAAEVGGVALAVLGVVLSPSGAFVPSHVPTACAVGCTLSPLRGCVSFKGGITGHAACRYFGVQDWDRGEPGLRMGESPAPKERKNAAHGVSRGYAGKVHQPQRGVRN